MRSTQFVGKARVVDIGGDEYRMELVGDPGCVKWSEEDAGKNFIVSIVQVDALALSGGKSVESPTVLLGYADPTPGDPWRRFDLECYTDRLLLNGSEPTDSEVVVFLKLFAAHYPRTAIAPGVT